MKSYEIYYVTNRKHKGKEQFTPTGYSGKFSASHQENLRFGKILVEADEKQIKKHLERDVKFGTGDGIALAEYLEKQAATGKIQAYPETLNKEIPDTEQGQKAFGSNAMFNDIQATMLDKTDVVVFIHGYNVSWESAVGSALALQLMFNEKKRESSANADKVLVILFTWPSDGKMIPFYSYISDRNDSEASGNAIARGMLKLRDFLLKLQIEVKNAANNNTSARTKSSRQLCQQDIHLLCHSMGNYLLQHTLRHLAKFTPQNTFPRLFKHIFLCAPDVDDTVLEIGQPLGDVHQIADEITVYYNQGDIAMELSDFTKGNPDRLGRNGAAHPNLIHKKIYQVDCTTIVRGFQEHSYYLQGVANDDIYLSIHDVDSSNRPTRFATSDARMWSLQSP